MIQTLFQMMVVKNFRDYVNNNCHLSDLNEIINGQATDEYELESQLNSTACNYYEYQDFNNMICKTRSKFSAFHMNIASMAVNTFNSEFLKPLLHKISSENKQALLLGDFNINLLNSHLDPASADFLDILGSNLIIPQILLPTRVTDHSKTLIDNIFSCVSETGCTSGNLCYLISDHLPQFCVFHSPDFGVKRKDEVFRHDWSKFDHENFILDFLDIDWEQIFSDQEMNPDTCFDVFDSKMKGLLEVHLPQKKLTKRQLKTRLKPWITPGILKSIAKRDHFFRKFTKSKNVELKSQFHNLFKSYRNMIVTLCRRSKSNFYTQYFNQYSSNMHKMWF